MKIDNTLKIDPKLAEPNQSWHFLVSYVEETPLSTSAKKVYKGIICPELLLWMAEAANVEEALIRKAKDVAINTMVDKREKGSNWSCRNEAGRKIKEIIPWEKIEENIIKEQKGKF